MKVYNLFIGLIILGSVTLIASCDSDEETPNKQQEFLKKLSFTWNVEKVMVGAKDVTSSFPNLVLKVNGDKTYSVTNPVAPIWSSTGTFTLQETSNANVFNIVRDDDAIIVIEELTTSSFRYSFEYTNPGGRVKSLEGEYEFTMIR